MREGTLLTESTDIMLTLQEVAGAVATIDVGRPSLRRGDDGAE
ncbi:hypothetical protein [uncultured Methylobacterium sp.]